MSRQRLALAWIACFAVLFNLLAMPLAGAMPKPAESTAGEQVLWSSFCTASGTKMVAIPLGSSGQEAPPSDHHSSMQHCWCCSGSASLLALPGNTPQLYLSQQARHLLSSVAVRPAPTPRQQWPSLNPRASPNV